MRVAIAMESMRDSRTVHELINNNMLWDVVWVGDARDKLVDYEQVKSLDLIMLDPLLAGKDVPSLVKQLLALCRAQIVFVSQRTSFTQNLIFRGLASGALDVIEKPDGFNQEKFIEKLRVINKFISLHSAGMGKQSSSCLLVIGSSTGGPGAVRELLSQFPADFPVAVLVAQHVDEEYAGGLAKWLDGLVPMTVRVAEPGDRPQAGVVLVGKTNGHLRLNARGTLEYSNQPEALIYRPSIDELFCSAALNWTGELYAALLTGMGDDGGRGLLALRRLAHKTFAQDEASSVIYGMPRSAAVRKAADYTLPPRGIGHRIKQMVYETRVQNKGGIYGTA